MPSSVCGPTRMLIPLAPERACNDSQLSEKVIVAIFYPFSQFCEIDISLLSLQTQPNTAPNLFQRGVEYGKYESAGLCQTDAVGQRPSTSALPWARLPRPPIARNVRAMRLCDDGACGRASKLRLVGRAPEMGPIAWDQGITCRTHTRNGHLTIPKCTTRHSMQSNLSGGCWGVCTWNKVP